MNIKLLNEDVAFSDDGESFQIRTKKFPIIIRFSDDIGTSKIWKYAGTHFLKNPNRGVILICSSDKWGWIDREGAHEIEDGKFPYGDKVHRIVVLNKTFEEMSASIYNQIKMVPEQEPKKEESMNWLKKVYEAVVGYASDADITSINVEENVGYGLPIGEVSKKAGIAVVEDFNNCGRCATHLVTSTVGYAAHITVVSAYLVANIAKIPVDTVVGIANISGSCAGKIFEKKPAVTVMPTEPEPIPAA